MRAAFEHGGRRFSVDLGAAPHDLSVPVDFAGGPGPRFFGLPAATRRAVEVGDFIGDTRRGGSCNCATITLTAHGNGTHTEGRGHIDDADVFAPRLVTGGLLPCAVVSVTPAERDIPLSAVRDALAALPDVPAPLAALVLRTLPNPASKATRDWDAAPGPAPTAALVTWVAAQGVRHLLLDVPSLDRADDAALTNHRLFWGAHPSGTVTELIFVPQAVPDGGYLLDLQLPHLLLDAVPSRPLLFPLSAA